MIWYCNVYACSNIRMESKVSIHEFPTPSPTNKNSKKQTWGQWHPTSTSYIQIYIYSEYFVGNICQNKIYYGMGLVKKLILKKDVVYPPNANMTCPIPITGTTLSDPVRSEKEGTQGLSRDTDWYKYQSHILIWSKNKYESDYDVITANQIHKISTAHLRIIDLILSNCFTYLLFGVL